MNPSRLGCGDCSGLGLPGDVEDNDDFDTYPLIDEEAAKQMLAAQVAAKE
jgi:hypothetical protein